MPETRTVTRVTLGDLRSDPACTGGALAYLAVIELPMGAIGSLPSGWTVGSIDTPPRRLPGSAGRVTWNLKPVVLRKGRGVTSLGLV